jgi:hypothetical protein
MYCSNIPFVYKPPDIVKDFYKNLINGKIKHEYSEPVAKPV